MEIDLKTDSRKVKPGDTFIAIRNVNRDGHDYIDMAIKNGAARVIVEEGDYAVETIKVKDTRAYLKKYLYENYYPYFKDMKLIGVTGTNGKTTIGYLMYQMMTMLHYPCAYMGTIGFYYGDQFIPMVNTTPDIDVLYDLFLKAKAAGCQCLVMEVSSHALDKERIFGLEFDEVAFTNLTQDHLDYHITMDNYFEAKALLFKGLEEGDFAVINLDDNYAERFLSVIPEGVRVFTYGVKKDADVKAKDIHFSLNGAEFTLVVNKEEHKVNLHMNGMFSVYNVLAAVTAAMAMEIDLKTSLKALENVKGVAGRFEVVAKKPLVIVDYAHTPDGLENVLNSAREITPKDGKLICLFGCGGDRDATKRPKMGAIAEKIADKIIITSDNPRSEDPQQIITDIIAGLKNVNPETVIVEPDRGHAIALLKTIAGNNDVVVIAGKGHENYQILKDRTIHFDDREEARKVFEGSVI